MSLPIYVDLCRFMSMATDIGRPLERHMSPATYVTRVATYVNGPTYVDDATDIKPYVAFATYKSKTDRHK